MKLNLCIDGADEGDPQSPLTQFDFDSVATVLHDELVSLFPNAERFAAAEISLSFLDAGDMQNVNREYRGVDELTDVLSFPIFEKIDEAEIGEVPQNLLPLGDIVISPEGVRSLHQDMSQQEALALMISHGFLHLLGWDHDTPAKEAAMWERQGTIKHKLLEKAGVPVGASNGNSD